ncbi:SprT-like domain-containing protein [Polaribacter sp. MED152]|uniref:SprT-like domain-containing protein n=1 Tax=Polaribacter sp. MED152 TaxID=313598 RepID=UPI000186F4B8|nr:SprT-like domain-containing protein [Polaribacter sp. MED152]
MNSILSKYIPDKAVLMVQYLIEQNNFSLKIVNQRETKHGDFRKMPDGSFQITVNNNLNQYQFLLTLVHEIAHHITHQKFGRVQPHGKEWKKVFQHLMLPFLKPDIFKYEMLPHLANYLKNPKASTDSDAKLSLALREFKPSSGKTFVFELPFGQAFLFKNTTYKKGNKRRTRFECLNTINGKVYLFNQNVEVEIIDN